MHPASLPEDELRKQCDLTRTRSSGPGGQHRNKVSTAVILTHRPTGIVGQASERRSPAENERVAMRRLRLLLAVEVRWAPPKPKGLEEIASDMWKSRRRDGRIACSESHKDFPAVLAEALDVIADSKWDPKKAGVRLGVTPTQLIKLAKKHPPALAKWNQEREKRGKGALV